MSTAVCTPPAPPSPPPSDITPNQLRAIGFLSIGQNASAVAQTCKVSRSTLYRWKEEQPFAKALLRQMREAMAAVQTQVQSLAMESIEGTLDGVRALRNIALREDVKPNIRRLAARDCVNNGDRWLDLLGYNAKNPSPSKLAIQEPPEPDEPETPDCIPDGEPETAEPLPISEMYQPNPMLHRRYQPTCQYFDELDERVRAAEAESAAPATATIPAGNETESALAPIDTEVADAPEEKKQDDERASENEPQPGEPATD